MIRAFALLAVLLPLTAQAAKALGVMLAAAVLMVSVGAKAAPPPKGSEDEKLMMPFKEWVTSQHDTLGRWCCDIGDGRPALAMPCDDHAPEKNAKGDWACLATEPDRWWVHVTPGHYEGPALCGGGTVGPGSPSCLALTPEGVWLPVPDEKIVRQANPTGTPILWMWAGRIQCFAPPDGV